MTSALGIDLSRNLSLFTVPAVFLATCLVPHMYAVTLAGEAFDNANPRGLRDSVSKAETLDKPTKELIIRAKNASDNGFETLGFFAAGVLAGNQAGLGPTELNILTLGYLAARVAYVGTYVFLGKDRRLASLRSIVWQVGLLLVFAIWIRAGFKVMRK